MPNHRVFLVELLPRLAILDELRVLQLHIFQVVVLCFPYQGSSVRAVLRVEVRYQTNRPVEGWVGDQFAKVYELACPVGLALRLLYS